MRARPWLAAAALAVLLAGAALTAAVTAQERTGSTKLEPYAVLSGCDSAVERREYHRITNRDDWLALWRRNDGEKREPWQRASYERWVLGLPEIDFERCMVVAVLEGSTDFTGVSLVSCVDDGEVVRFRFLAGWQRDPIFPSPPPEDPEGKSVPPRFHPREIEDPSPYDFFVLPRSGRPLVIEEKVSTGEKGGWRFVERARFE
jgi:hypothetical protein